MLKNKTFLKVLGLGTILGIVSFSSVGYASDELLDKEELYESISSIRFAPVLEAYDGGEYVKYPIAIDNLEVMMETLWQYSDMAKEPVVISKAEKIRFKVNEASGNIAIVEKNASKSQVKDSQESASKISNKSELRDNIVKIFDSNQELIFEKNLFTTEEYKALKIKSKDSELDLILNSWSSDGRYLWVYAKDENVLFRIDTETKEIFPIANVELGEDMAFNPNKGWICYSDYSKRYEKAVSSGLKNQDEGIYLKARDLINGQVVDIATKSTLPFNPKWLDNDTIVYKDRNENWVNVSWK